MSYRAWLCVKILRSYAGFQVTLVYELTSYTRWCLLNSLTHLFYDQIVKYLIYVWWWFSSRWNSFELIQNFRYYVLSKYRYIYTSHYHKVLCKVLFIGSSHIDMCYYQWFTQHLNNSFNQWSCLLEKQCMCQMTQSQEIGLLHRYEASACALF